MNNPTETGTIFIGRWYLSRKPFWDTPVLHAATPVARFGNLFVYHGTFYLPGLLAIDSYFAGLSKLDLAGADPVEAERLFRQSVSLDPKAYFVYIELGNLALARGDRKEALQQYRAAARYAGSKALARPIGEQIQRISASSSDLVPALRDPMVE